MFPRVHPDTDGWSCQISQVAPIDPHNNPHLWPQEDGWNLEEEIGYQETVELMLGSALDSFLVSPFEGPPVVDPELGEVIHPIWPVKTAESIRELERCSGNCLAWFHLNMILDELR